MFKILLISLAFACAFASNLGVDFSAWQGTLSVSTFQCFVRNGIDFVIGQIWNKYGEINPGFLPSFQNAQTAGITTFDAYAFICNNNQFTPAQICNSLNSDLPQNYYG